MGQRGVPLLGIGSAGETQFKRAIQPLVAAALLGNQAQGVLNGVQAHEEDRIRELRAGDVCIRLVKPCDRCSITTTDQVTGLRRGDEPLRTLKSYRWDPKLRGVTFGQNGILVSGAGASLRVGQEFDITWV